VVRLRRRRNRARVRPACCGIRAPPRLEQVTGESAELPPDRRPAELRKGT
jgi:hypothetical protein